MTLDASTLLGAAVGFLLRELGGRAVDNIADRAGRAGYSARECGFFCENELEDGRKVEAQYRPGNMFKDALSHELRATGDLFNDSRVSLLLTKPQVQFWSTTGLRSTYLSPRLSTSEGNVSVISIPAHGRISLRLTMSLVATDLEDYSGVLPVLVMHDVRGRERTFRLSAASFYGTFTTWPRKGRLPIQIP